MSETCAITVTDIPDLPVTPFFGDLDTTARLNGQKSFEAGAGRIAVLTSPSRAYARARHGDAVDLKKTANHDRRVWHKRGGIGVASALAPGRNIAIVRYREDEPHTRSTEFSWWMS